MSESGFPQDQPSRTSSWAPWQVFRGWPRAARWSAYLAVGVVLAMVVGLVTAVALVRRPFPQVDGTIEVPGLSGPVEVVRDAHGIPHVYADTTADLMAAQGFVHAQERFYEMDVRRHSTAGRLSELFGPETLEIDTFVRTLGWRRVAERELALLQPRTRGALDAYASGVNAYLETHTPSEMAVQYSLLGLGGLDYRPEPWTAVDSLSWLKAMAWDLKGNLDEEIERALVSADHTADQLADLYPDYDYQAQQPIVGQGAVVDGIFEQDATRGGTRNPQRPAYTADQRAQLGRLKATIDRLPHFLGGGLGGDQGSTDGWGSNSWVVDGELSGTGAPLLANDPHLGVSVPGIWVQMGLHCRTVTEECPFDVSGFTFSGVPGVVIGHNADIAWGFTNLGLDVTDLFLERVTEEGEWEHDGRLRPMEVREETIKVRGEDDVTIEVRSTSHGPLISDASPFYDDLALTTPGDPSGSGSVASAETSPAVSLGWTALTPARTADAIFDLNAATDWASFREAVSAFAVPAQNIVYADRAGHIGYQAPGLVPIRKSGNDGLMPQAGWLSENDWTGEFVPFDALPNLLDPDEGFVVTANQAVVGPDYPYFLTSDWDRGYRSQRIRDLIESATEEGETLTVEDMTRIQLDDRSPLAAALVPHLLAIDLPPGYWSAGQRQLRTWDFSQPADSAAAEYFNVVWRTLLAITFHDEMVEDVWPSGGDRWMAVVTRLLDEPDSSWWDDRGTVEVETRDDILDRALREARDEVTRLDSMAVEGWEWGHLHRLDLEEATLGTSGVGPFEWLVNRGGWEVGGGPAAVDASSYTASLGYRIDSAPSMRMVVSLADFDDSRWINLTGVSGHPFSDHYTDQTDLWARGETLPWPFSREAVLGAGEHTLRLVPAA